MLRSAMVAAVLVTTICGIGALTTRSRSPGILRISGEEAQTTGLILKLNHSSPSPTHSPSPPVSGISEEERTPVLDILSYLHHAAEPPPLPSPPLAARKEEESPIHHPSPSQSPPPLFLVSSLPSATTFYTPPSSTLETTTLIPATFLPSETTTLFPAATQGIRDPIYTQETTTFFPQNSDLTTLIPEEDYFLADITISTTAISTSTVASPSETYILGLSRAELAAGSAALVLLILASVASFLTYFLCKSQFTRRNIYTTMDEHEFNPVGSHFTNPGPPVILDHEHSKPKKRDKTEL